MHVKKEHHLSSQTAALEQIIAEHKHGAKSVEISKQIANEVEEKLKDTLTAIRLSSRFSDKNIQIALELLNTLLVHKGIENVCLTDEMPSGAYEQSKKKVEEKIKHYREIQISNSVKKKSKQSERNFRT